jgi:hypothetical protein
MINECGAVGGKKICKGKRSTLIFGCESNKLKMVVLNNII